MYIRELLYELALRGARSLLRLAAPFSPGVGRGLAGRAAALGALESWAESARDPVRPLVWVHAPSVGEALMAQAIIGALRERRPEVQVVFTYFSVSAERIAERVGANLSTYLPWDLTGESRRVLATLRPDLLAFVRTEIWPVLAREARAAGVRVVLVNAVLAEGSSRLRGPARYLLGPGYRRLDAAGAVAAGDGERLLRLGVQPERVRVTGDARFDQVWARVRALGAARGKEWVEGQGREQGEGAGGDRGEVQGGGQARDRREGQDNQQAYSERPLLRRLRDPTLTTLVAGSTWPADEEHLLPAFRSVRAESGYRLIIAPHEPTAAHLASLEARLTTAGLSSARLSEVESTVSPLPEVVVVDRVGVLAELYAVADIAYVGGGFGSAGLHSVVEPAALGVPVLFGPRFGNALEADALARAGGGNVVRGAESITSSLLLWARNSERRAEASTAALAFVQSRLGGAAGNAELIAALLEARVRAG